jgi:nascent polypeptide-associated complex subunit alpha
LQHDEPVVEDDDDEEDEDDDEEDDEEDDNAEGKLVNKIYCFCACDFYSIFNLVKV